MKILQLISSLDLLTIEEIAMIGTRIIRIQNIIIRNLDQDHGKATITRNVNLDPGQGLL